MCRLVIYLGSKKLLLADLTIRPKNGIVHQSFHNPFLPFLEGNVADIAERNSALNGDGFGIAVYVDEPGTGASMPLVFTSTNPSWNDRNLRRLALLLESQCVLAHVRAASPGVSSINVTNCHPFSFGRFVFAHNGLVGNFRAIRVDLWNLVRESSLDIIEGTTDSEVCFAVFLHFLHQRGPGRTDFALSEIRRALLETIRTVVCISAVGGDAKPPLQRGHCGPDAVAAAARRRAEPSSLNFVVTDGSVAVCSRFRNAEDSEPPSLYWALGKNPRFCEETGHFQFEEGEEEGEADAGFFHPGTGVLVSSEPLTEQHHWKLIPKNTMVSIAKGKCIEFEQIVLS